MATASGSETGLERDTVPRTNQPLNLYSGTFVPGIYFSSGYCLLAFDFTSVPPNVDPFIYVWIITPDGERTLYADPEEGIELVSGYHTVDQGVGGHITREQTGSDTVRVTVEGNDGTNLELELSVGQTMATRALNALSALTPKTVARTQFGAALGTVLLDRLLETNGTKVAGRTEIGSPYRFEADHINIITDASATLNGEDLGTPTAPDRLVEFGDVKIGNIPLYMRADAYLPIPKQDE